jgi:hypothetical protein
VNGSELFKVTEPPVEEVYSMLIKYDLVIDVSPTRSRMKVNK